MVVLVCSFDSAFVHNGRDVLAERNIFFVAPLFFIALVALIEANPRPRARWLALMPALHRDGVKEV